MKELFDKLSSYNIFNYLFPGTVFSVIITNISHYNFLLENHIIGGFYYYFTGLVISRIGSLILENRIEKWKLIQKATYTRYVQASAKDTKIDSLSEVNNMYRTLFSMALLLIVVWAYSLIDSQLNIENTITVSVSLISLLFLFFFSHKKQTGYITERINITLDK
jgi:hypothetical protein